MSRDTRLPLPRYAESMLAIVAASLLIRLVPFRTLMRWSAAPAIRPPADQRTVAEVRRSVLAAAVRVPWRAMCFEQGLAAAWMLRRRGCHAEISYGAATIDGELKAHVWLCSGARGVVGYENASDYALLARFPRSAASP